MAPSTLLIAGTDTGVGKTWIGCALGRALAVAGRRVVALKPVETGCSAVDSETEDGALLARATGQTEPLHALVRLRAPVAPAASADREGTTIDFDEIALGVREHALRADVTLVEGAGGLLTPLTWEQSALDLARTLEARVLLVSPDRLGTISHTLMALKLLAHERLELAGIVLVPPEEPDASTGSNAGAINRLWSRARILCAPRTEDAEAIHRFGQELADALLPAYQSPTG